MNEATEEYTAFDGHRMMATGTLREAALAVKRCIDQGARGPVLLFDNASGRTIDIDTRGSDQEMVARLPNAASPQVAASVSENSCRSDARGRGRPKLGVVAREVTLLPRHWEWLGNQPGGASVAMRRLVEEARRSHAARDARRAALAAAYTFMSTVAGNYPGFEEAARALFSEDREAFGKLTAGWPRDVRHHVYRRAFGDEL
jgi:uncharacterized protein